MRISKKYEERKKELLTAAEQLFYKHGYDQTSVNTIIETVGVSKGTFYHYFKSKEELLDCLADKMAHAVLHEIRIVVDKPELDAISKFRNVLDVTRHWKLQNRELVLTIIKVVYQDENIFIRHKMDQRNLELIQPEFTKIIKQGINEGVFNTINPGDTAETILLLGNQIKEVIAKLLFEMTEKPETLQIIERKLVMFGNSLERILGAPENSLGIPNKTFMTKFLTAGNESCE